MQSIRSIGSQCFAPHGREGGTSVPQSPTAPTFSPFFYSSGPVQPVPAYQVIGLNCEIKLINEGTYHEQLRTGEICFASHLTEDRDFLVAQDAFDLYAREIYEFERILSTKNLPEDQNNKTTRAGFFKLEDLILQPSSPKNMRHLSFMIKEASEIGCDYATLMAILLHNVGEKEAKRHLLSIKAGKSLSRQVLETREVFLRLNSLQYHPASHRAPDEIETCILFAAKLTQKNWRALVVFWVHKYSAIKTQSEDANDITARTITEVCAPLAEWFGKRSFASKLRNEAYRLHCRADYDAHEQKIVEWLGMSRTEAKLFLEEIRKKLTVAFDATIGRTRVKTPWGAWAKREYKPEEYADIENMQDLLAGMFVTREKMKLKSVVELVLSSLEEAAYGINYEKGQTETKRYEIDGKSISVHHVAVKLKNGNDLELQFMDEETYRIIEMGERAHWAYKLEQLTGQKFNAKFLGSCSLEMNGDLAHDLAVVVDRLEPWVFPFYEENGKGPSPKRIPRGSIPFDFAAQILEEGEIFKYGGTEARKFWEVPKQRRKRGEYYEIEDGEVLSIKLGATNWYLEKIAQSDRVLRPATETGSLYLSLFTPGLFSTAIDLGEETIKRILRLNLFSNHAKERILRAKKQLGFGRKKELFAYFGLHRNKEKRLRELLDLL